MKMSEQNRKKIEEVSKIDLDMAGVEQKPSYFDYRLGWQVDPKGGVSQIPDFLKVVGRMAHADWEAAIDRGDAPPEDISPWEGFAHLARKLEEYIACSEG
jgi:hypothetical protein